MAFHKLISLLLFCLFNLPVLAKTVPNHRIMADTDPATSTASIFNKDVNKDSSTCILNEEDSISRRSLPLSNTGKLMPCIRQHPIAESLETIAAHKITAFLAAPRVRVHHLHWLVHKRVLLICLIIPLMLLFSLRYRFFHRL